MARLYTSRSGRGVRARAHVVGLATVIDKHQLRLALPGREHGAGVVLVLDHQAGATVRVGDDLEDFGGAGGIVQSEQGFAAAVAGAITAALGTVGPKQDQAGQRGGTRALGAALAEGVRPDPA